MIFAEPGHPYTSDCYDAGRGPDSIFAQAVEATFGIMNSSQDIFHRNVRWFIDQILPHKNLREQLENVWLTEGRLCSVDQEIGGRKDRLCAQTYLLRQIELMPQAIVIGFGGKAQAYLSGLKVPHIAAYSLAPPGSNHRPARPSWEMAAVAVRTKSPA